MNNSGHRSLLIDAMERFHANYRQMNNIIMGTWMLSAWTRGMAKISLAMCCLLMWGLPCSSAFAQEVGEAAPVDQIQANLEGATTPGGAWDLANAADRQSLPPAPLYGPPSHETLPAEDGEERHASFGRQMGAVKWEVAAIAAYMTVTQIIVTKETESFHFQDEGWFGKNTKNLGVDKLTHAFNTYLITEFLHERIDRKTGGTAGGPLTAAILATALMTYSELYDAHKTSSGFSNQDMISNVAGAGFSVLRNTIPGLKEKLDFRLLLMPNSDIYTPKGKKHYAQQRFLLALTLAGFEEFHDSPLRFVELHAGYYVKGLAERGEPGAAPPQRRPFFGVGLNLKELFFKGTRSKVGRAAGTALDYIQVPYTGVYMH